MKKDKENLSFDFDNDPEFSANFYKNIEKALEDSENPEATIAKETGNPEAVMNDEIREPIITEAEELDIISMSENAEEIPDDEIAAASSTAEKLHDSEIDDELTDINNSLAMQISAEMDTFKGKETSGKRKFFFRLQNGVVLTILCLLGFGFFFGFTNPGNHLLMDMGINIGGFIWDSRTNDFKDNTVVSQDIDIVDPEDASSDAQEIDPSTIVMPNNSLTGRKEDGVFNILLLGEEAIGMGASRGRTDDIEIATLNTKDNSLKVTSLMRDELVKIPGFKDNKLNVAYEEGGISLLYETIAVNFDVHIDGSILVNFDNFEKIVDDLGGLEITLTKAEAQYLNTTNYISDPANRHVVEGPQLMNGNQVLGYSRVRHRAAITGNNNDYGRTDRHRIVLNEIFKKCKTMDKAQLAALMYKFLPMITTDIGSKNFQNLLDAYLQTGATQIQQLRIPADGTFQDNVKVRGMSVLIPDYTKNISILQSFIFGDNPSADSNGTSDTSGNTSTNTTDNTANSNSNNTGN